MKRIWRPVTYFLAVVYFLVDLIFSGVARPISEWVGRHIVSRRLRNWIRSLPPYPSLALFSVPVILLEPVKPIAAYMAATGQFLSAALTFVSGELVKLVLVERLFSLTRDKLLKIPAFAWAYRNYQTAKAWLEATEAWQIIRLMGRSVLGHLANWRLFQRVVHGREHVVEVRAESIHGNDDSDRDAGRDKPCSMAVAPDSSLQNLETSFIVLPSSAPEPRAARSSESIS